MSIRCHISHKFTRFEWSSYQREWFSSRWARGLSRLSPRTADRRLGEAGQGLLGKNILEEWRGVCKSSMTGSKKIKRHDMIYFFTISYVDDLFGYLYLILLKSFCVWKGCSWWPFFSPLVLKNSFSTAHTRRTPGDVSDHNHHFQDHQCPWWRDDCDHWCLWGWLGWLGRMGWI